MVVHHPPRNNVGIPAPQTPLDPPSLKDISNARRYVQELTLNKDFSTQIQHATEDDVSAAEVYQHDLRDDYSRHSTGQVLITRDVLDVAVRDRFRVDMADIMRQALQPLNDRVGALEEKVAGGLAKVEDDLQKLSDSVNQINVRSIRIFNSTCSTGGTRPYEEIPFSHGQHAGKLPSEASLPALSSHAVIAELENAQLKKYVQGYGLDFQRREGNDSLIRKLCVHLGIPNVT